MKMPKYRTETNADLIGAITDIDKRLSIIERTPQSASTPGVSGIYFHEILPKDPPDRAINTTFLDLEDGDGGGAPGTLGPTVTVPISSSGQALVTLTLYTEVPGFHLLTAGFEISGATTRTPSEVYSLRVGGSSDNFQTQSAVFLVTGLSTGSNTFTVKYRSDFGTEIFVWYRSLIVQPA